MPIDYDKIREDNIRRYGTDVNVYGPTLLEGQYSDQTHFIYELLQNAEDAEASRVVFRLSPRRLKLEHNGRAFTEDDVIGICGLVRGTKGDDLTKIGKFGIGFKSVYAHTNTPRIHCGEDHFLVRDYVHPYATQARDTNLGTVFVFPFDRKDTTPAKSCSAISSRLRTLEVETLLFLRNIESIEFALDDGVGGILKRHSEDILEANFAKVVKLTEQNEAGQEFEDFWLVFSRDVAVSTEETKVTQNVEIAFLLEDSHRMESLRIRPLTRSELVVYFPTAMPTGLGFLVQGPYRTNTARDRIADDTPFNARLIIETGELLVDALRWLRDRKWLTAKVLETMPLAYIERERYYDYNSRVRLRENVKQTYGDFLEPAYQKVKHVLLTEAIIPALGGGFVAARNAKTVEGAELREILENANEGRRIGIEDDTQWIADEITANRTPNLWRFLTTTLEVEEIDTEKFVRRLDVEFLKNQSDDWVRRFYEFAPTSYTIKAILREKPIIRLSDGRHVKPDSAYLPSNYLSGFPTVKQDVCNSTKSLRFLKDLGLEAPDIVEEVVKLVLPRYGSAANIDDEAHKKDIALIIQALSEASQQRRYVLERSLANVRFLRATNATGASAYRRSNDLYIRSSELEVYFMGNPDAWFLSMEYEEHYDELMQLGVADSVRIQRRMPRWDQRVIIERGYGWHVHGINGFDPDCSIDELEFALKSPTIERAQLIWNILLIPYRQLIEGKIQTSTNQSFTAPQTETKVSKLGKLARDLPWLPDGNGGFVKPSKLTLDDLPRDFLKDGELANALGMRPAIGAVFATLLESEEISEDDKLRLKFAIGLSDVEIELIKRLRENELETPEAIVPGDFPYELGDALDQSEGNTRSASIYHRSRVQEAPDDPRIVAEEEMVNEPNMEERYKVNTRRKWEAKNPKTRRFLYNEYGGECQICGDTFEKRNGENYFESVHLVWRTKAKWLDHPRNALCLCANHSAQFHAGEIATPEGDIIEGILSSDEGQPYSIDIMLCKQPQTITFSSNHIDELRGGLEAAEQH